MNVDFHACVIILYNNVRCNNACKRNVLCVNIHLLLTLSCRLFDLSSSIKEPPYYVFILFGELKYIHTAAELGVCATEAECCIVLYC